MRYQDQIVKVTQKALDDVCRAALAVPADKLEWCPTGKMRSVLNQMQEIAVSATFFMPLIKTGVAPEFDAEARRKATELQRSFDTLDKCIDEARRTVAVLCQAIGAVPDAQLETEVVVPFGGGVVMTAADVLGTAAWNMTYHLGQINQIQLMLGDMQMH